MKRTQSTSKSKTFIILFAACILLSLVFSAGCNSKFLNPTRIGRFRPVPAVNVILDSLGVAGEESSPFEGAEEPRPEDVVVSKSDYAFYSGDTVLVYIFELLQEGVPWVYDYVITETGRISIPEVGTIQVEGLTELQLEEEIKRILEPSILKNPQVTVTMSSSQQRTFSISGSGIPAPGRYGIPRIDYRLLDAIATAGGISQFNTDYVYVIRSLEDKAGPVERIQLPKLGELELIGPGIIEPEELIEPGKEMLEIIAPRVQKLQKNRYKWPDSKVVVTSSEMATDKEFDIVVLPEGFGRINSRRRGWSGIRKVPGLFAGPVDSETTDESLKDEPVSIKDILKTLAEKPNQDRVDEQIDVDEILKSFDEPETYGGADEPIDVEELLKSLDQSQSSPPAEVEQVQVQQQQDQADIEEMLKSLGGPDEAIETKIVDEQIGIDNVLEMLDTTDEPVESVTTQDEEKTGRIEWIFQDGKWVPVQVGRPKIQEPVIKIEPGKQVIIPGLGPLTDRVIIEPEWTGPGTRVIKIPARKLNAGDPRYNIVIKPGDDIQIPVNIMGEFCIIGNVNQQGYINMTGRQMTLKMAIAAAGGLGPLAYPKRCEVVRRLGENKEEIVSVDLDKIASGEQPDFFIKPNDLINVGTHYSAQWRTVLRNAFRATYGFGYLYDRNFAYDAYYRSKRIQLREAIKMF